MMNKKKIIGLLIMFSGISVYALSNSFKLDTSELSFVSDKKNNVVNDLKNDYNLKYSMKDDNDSEKEELKKLAKKTTYLLFGAANNTKETSEHFYNRKKDYQALRYNPKIQDNYSTVASFANIQIFNQASELQLQYNSFGDISISINNDIAIAIVELPNVKIKEKSKTDPMKYDIIKTNYKMYYAYHKQESEWKLWYIFGEESQDVEAYVNEIESMESKTMAIAPTYQSLLTNAYSYSKLNAIKESTFKDIHDKNKNSIVYLNGYYNNKIVTRANGFFINDGLIVTTWDFIEKSLVNSQYITIIGNGVTYAIKGIVTINPNVDLAVIKVDKHNSSKVIVGDHKELKVEDPVIIISSKYGTGTILQKGIVVNIDNYIQTSIPISEVDAGSPLFNQKGEVIGMNSSKSVNSSISMAINSDALKEVKDIFKSVNYDQIESVSFDELKEKYYYVKLDSAKEYNNIPKDKWNEYSKIGNIEENIKLPLIKASYNSGVVSLRYQNSIASVIKSKNLAVSFAEQLIKDGYKKIIDSSSKSIYSNDSYKVIISEEFDYLIIVMVKL